MKGTGTDPLETSLIFVAMLFWLSRCTRSNAFDHFWTSIGSSFGRCARVSACGLTRALSHSGMLKPHTLNDLVAVGIMVGRPGHERRKHCCRHMHHQTVPCGNWNMPRMCLSEAAVTPPHLIYALSHAIMITAPLPSFLPPP